MALITSLPYLFLLLLSVANSGSGYGLVNPDLHPTYECNPDVADYSGRPHPISCAVAVTQLPDSYRDVDWHHDPHGQIIYHNPLMFTSDLNARNHLPHVSVVAECRVRVELRPGAQSADLVWSDLKVFALMLVRRCVGDERTTSPTRKGPGSGGICEFDNVRISIEPVRPMRMVSSQSSVGSTRSDLLDSTA